MNNLHHFIFSGECCKSDEINIRRKNGGGKERCKEKEKEREKKLGWEEGETEKADCLCPQGRSGDVTPAMDSFR